MSLVDKTRVDADLAAQVLILFRDNPTTDWTVRQVWARLPHNTPLGAVNGICKTLHRSGHLSMQRPRSGTDRVRVYRLAAAA